MNEEQEGEMSHNTEDRSVRHTGNSPSLRQACQPLGEHGELDGVRCLITLTSVDIVGPRSISRPLWFVYYITSTTNLPDIPRS